MLSAICGRTPVASLPKRSPSLYHFAERESELLAIFQFHTHHCGLLLRVI